jgi:hypothetical protein
VAFPDEATLSQGYTITRRGGGPLLSRADVQVCRAEGAPPATTADYAFLFALEMENGTRIATEGTGFNGDELLVQNDPVAEGDCVRGVVISHSPVDERPGFRGVLLELSHQVGVWGDALPV